MVPKTVFCSRAERELRLARSDVGRCVTWRSSFGVNAATLGRAAEFCSTAQRPVGGNSWALSTLGATRLDFDMKAFVTVIPAYRDLIRLWNAPVLLLLASLSWLLISNTSYIWSFSRQVGLYVTWYNVQQEPKKAWPCVSGSGAPFTDCHIDQSWTRRM